MGATNFHTIQVVKDHCTMSEAYSSAVSDALYQHGHDAYNGTISTTQGYKDCTRMAPVYGTPEWDKWENDVVLEDQIPGVEKWGKAAGVELKGKSLENYLKERNMSARPGSKVFVFIGWAAT